MTLAKNIQNHRSCLAVRLGGALAASLIVGLLLANSAAASFEQVATFGNTEGQRVGQSIGINVSGAGGLPAGTVYSGGHTYNAKGEFLGTWASDANGYAIDQATGNVYVLAGQVFVYNADGTKLLDSFGEEAGFAETIEESPEKFHGTFRSGIAVDDSGTVYVADSASGAAGGGHRVMVFKPQSPGDYEHYVYTGRENDIVTGPIPSGSLRNIALDDAGNLYVQNEELAIYELSLANPNVPICEYQAPGGGVQAMTVNPASGEVFYFKWNDKKIHQLSACNAQGKFEEMGVIPVTPKTENIYGLAFDPSLSYAASRPAGILYAAETTGGLVGIQGFIFAPAEAVEPAVESESVSSVTAFSANLEALINPKGSETRFTFQYLTEAAYQANEPADRFAGATEAPLGGGVLGTGQTPLSAAVSVSGLQADTTYRYRVVATSHCEPDNEESLCEAAGDAKTFRTFPVEVAGLPDGRAYELVSPVEKHGGEVMPAEPGLGRCGFFCKPGLFVAAYPMQSSPDGGAVVYKGFPFSPSEGASGLNEYISSRTPSGWQTTPLSPALQGGGPQEGHIAFDPGLSKSLLYEEGESLPPGAPAEYPNLFEQSSVNPATLTPLLGAPPPNRSPSTFRLGFVGASADFSHRFFSANDALTQEAPFAPAAMDGGEKNDNLYEWANGELRLVNVLPGNQESAPGAVFGSGEMLVAENDIRRAADYSHAISNDGSRVFWSTEDGQVYVRESGEVTREIPDHTGKFVTASADGSRVLLSNGHLLDLDGEEGTTDLTQGKGAFRGIAGQSEDLSRIYFVDGALLSGEEENDYGAKAEAGKNNLYAWHEGSTTYIATLGPFDNEGDSFGGGGAWKASPSARRAEASPDGRWLTFLSRAPLTASDNVGPSCIFTSNAEYKAGPCADVFLFDSATGHLICASCSISGSTPLGSSNLRLIQGFPASLPQPRYLLDSGRLYFDSQDSLSPFDSNEGVEDVYQFEPEGVGTCNREEGCVSLISAGTSSIDSNFVAIDETGKNVFFTSRDRLVQEDHDELIDLYVAREGGGFAPEPPSTECVGEACQPVLPQAEGAPPATSSYVGPGNLRPRHPQCRRGKVRRHGRCVKKHRSGTSHHSRAHSNRGGSK